MIKKFVEFFKKFVNWFKQSNRFKHFIYGIPVGFVFTILAVLGCASGMEFKDYQWGGKPSFADWACTMVGGFIGQALQLLVVYLIVR